MVIDAPFRGWSKGQSFEERFTRARYQTAATMTRSCCVAPKQPHEYFLVTSALPAWPRVGGST